MSNFKNIFEKERKSVKEPLPNFDKLKQKIELLEVLKSLFELYVEVPSAYTSSLIIKKNKYGQSNPNAN